MELIRFGTPNAKPPVLLIHGSYCGAWIWEPYFQPALAAAGWWGAALALRGHEGAVPPTGPTPPFGIRDYLEDIAQAAKELGQTPILVGHSMGGYLAQKYALENEVRGLALLAAPSLMGLGSSATHIALHRPALAMQLAQLVLHGPGTANGQIVINALFNDTAASEKLAAYASRLQGESPRLSIEATWPDLRLPPRFPPTVVIGGDDDAFVPTADFHHETMLWRAQSHILQGVSHGLMLDSCHERVFEILKDWLDQITAAA